MDENIKNRIKRMAKSMSKKRSAKDAIADVLDKDRIAEVSPDEITPNTTSAVNKSKDLDKCNCEGDCDCECDSPKDDLEKGEKVIKDILSKFEAISKAYLAKMELKKGKMASMGERKTVEIYDKAKKGYRDTKSPFSNMKTRKMDEKEKNIKNKTKEQPLAASEK